MIQVGQKVRFDALWGIRQSIEKITAPTIGTVVYVNERHNWFSVLHSGSQRASFKFHEIGQNVFVCK